MSRRAADETWLDDPIDISLSRQDVLLIESLLWRVQDPPVAVHLVPDRAYATMLNATLSRFVAPAAEIRAELSRRLEAVGVSPEASDSLKRRKRARSLPPMAKQPR